MEIRSASDWERAQAAFDYFHDSVVHSLIFENDQTVRSDGTMDMGRGEARQGKARATVVVQTQDADHSGGTITFHGVHSTRYDAGWDVQPGGVESLRIGGRDLLRFVFAGCEVVAAYATVQAE